LQSYYSEVINNEDEKCASLISLTLAVHQDLAGKDLGAFFIFKAIFYL